MTPCLDSTVYTALLILFIWGITGMSTAEQAFVEKLKDSSTPQWMCRFVLRAACTHRYHLLFLALLGQVLDAINKKLVGADVGPSGLNHPTAQLHQLVRGNKNNHFERTTKNAVYLKSHMFYPMWCKDINRVMVWIKQSLKGLLVTCRMLEDSNT